MERIARRMNTPAIVWTKWRMLNELASIGGWRGARREIETEGACDVKNGANQRSIIFPPFFLEVKNWREPKIQSSPAKSSCFALRSRQPCAEIGSDRRRVTTNDNIRGRQRRV